MNEDVKVIKVTLAVYYVLKYRHSLSYVNITMY